MTDDDIIDAEVKAIRAEYADEEAENAEAEALENTQAVLSVRVPTQLAESLKERAARERIPTSALVRRLLTNGMHGRTDPVITAEQVEDIARRVMKETTDH
jgi:predicted DNA binding CopG/RHH family protein